MLCACAWGCFLSLTLPLLMFLSFLFLLQKLSTLERKIIENFLAIRFGTVFNNILLLVHGSISPNIQRNIRMFVLFLVYETEEWRRGGCISCIFFDRSMGSNNLTIVLCIADNGRSECERETEGVVGCASDFVVVRWWCCRFSSDE